MAGSLAGRIAVVTGSSRGIGRGTAVALGEQGATVYITGRSTGDTDDPGLHAGFNLSAGGDINASAANIKLNG